MSKSLGNVINPLTYAEKYGADALRYYLLAKISPFDDSDMTKEKFEQVYQADLANGLGNLVARVAAMADVADVRFHMIDISMSEEVARALEQYKFDEAMGIIWNQIKKADTLISERRVWELKGEEKKKIRTELVLTIRQIGVDLQPFLPETAEKILAQFGKERIEKKTPLFPRLMSNEL